MGCNPIPKIQPARIIRDNRRLPAAQYVQAPGGFGFVVALAIWRGPTLGFVKLFEEMLPLNVGRRLRLAQMARDFAEGTDSLRSARVCAMLLGWTFATWLCSMGSIWSGMTAVGIDPRLAPLLFVIVLTSTGQAVPSSPGYVGVYHYLATQALVFAWVLFRGKWLDARV